MSLRNLVVFDLDGTLNRTELYAVSAHKKALAHYGITNISDEQILSTFGASDEEFFGLLGIDFPEDERKKYIRVFAEYEFEEIKHHKASYPNVKEMLTELRKLGYITAVCSNASVRYIRLVLTELELLELIDYIQPIEPSLAKDDTLKKLLERCVHNKAVMVGDRFYDKRAAKSNNIPFIGCKYGFCASEVEDADIAVDDASEIPNAVKTLIG